MWEAEKQLQGIGGGMKSSWVEVSSRDLELGWRVFCSCGFWGGVVGIVLFVAFCYRFVSPSALCMLLLYFYFYSRLSTSYS